MPLSVSGRIVFAAFAVLLLWLVVSSARRADTVATVTYAIMTLMFGLPAIFGRDSFAAHAVPVPRWLRWMYKSQVPGVQGPNKPPAP